MYAQFKFPKVPWALRKVFYAVYDWKHWPTIRYYIRKTLDS